MSNPLYNNTTYSNDYSAPNTNLGYVQGAFSKASMTIQKLIFRETGTYNPTYRRNYITDLNENVISNLGNAIVGNRKVNRLDPGIISNAGGGFIQLGADITEAVGIDNGWNTKRAIFLMEVLVVHRTGSECIYYIQGYTDHLGLTVSGNIDQNMVLYINSIMECSTVPFSTPNGIIRKQNVLDCSHYLADRNSGGLMSGNNGITQSMRPEDIFAHISVESLLRDSNYYDARMTMTNMAMRSNRANNIATQYASDILQAYVGASLHQEMNDDDSTIYDKARTSVNSKASNQNHFLSAISREAASTFISNYLTYGTLLKIDPSIGARTNIIFNDNRNGSYHGMHYAGQTCEWNSTSLETVIANSLSVSIPSLMLSLMITKCTFTTTNQTLDGKMFTTLISAASFTGVDDILRYEEFKRRLECYELVNVSRGNQIPFTISCTADSLGDTRLSIDIGNGVYDYCIPTFSDHLYTPVATKNGELFNKIADDFRNTCDAIGDEIRGVSSRQHSPIVTSGYGSY
jgi:hypothetical protein